MATGHMTLEQLMSSLDLDAVESGHAMDATFLALLGVDSLATPPGEAAWARARRQAGEVPDLIALVSDLHGRAGRLQDPVEDRFGSDLGRPWKGLRGSLDLLRTSLGHLVAGRRSEFVDGVDRYEQWRHSAMLKIEGQVADVGTR